MPGYSLCSKDKQDINGKYLCLQCSEALRDPVQTPCGHFYCKSCLGSLKKADGTLVCILDQQRFTTNEVFSDKCITREVLSVKVGCQYADGGCKWRGEIRDLDDHLPTCPAVQVACSNPNCAVRVKRSEIEQHEVNECTNRPIACSFCKETVSASLLQNHVSEDCERYPSKCTGCGKEGIPRGEIKRHQDKFTGDCEAIEKQCPYQPIGCRTAKNMKHAEAKRHEGLCSVFHLNLLLRYILNLEKYISSNVLAVAATGYSEEVRSNLDGIISTAITNIDYVISGNVGLAEKMREQGSRLTELERKFSARESRERTRSPPFGSLEGQRSPAPATEISRRLVNAENLTGNNEVLLCENARCCGDVNQQVTSLTRQLRSSVDTIRQIDRKLESTERNLALKNVSLADLEHNLRRQEVCSYNGVFLWKIDDFARRKNDAVTGRMNNFCSPCFYSSRYGYKACARIYLNGDGAGRGTHIGIFFIVMRGEYDGLLRWPFRQKVTIMLLDQDNVEHVIDAFRPDPSSSSFQRPRREMNVASGCPLFCPLSELSSHAYVRDDTMFIKIIIDTSDL